MADKQPPHQGAGRGGRGAALFAALQKIHRRPGEQGQGDAPIHRRPEEQGQGDAPTSIQVTPTPSSQTPAVGGRGASIAQLLRSSRQAVVSTPSQLEPLSPTQSEVGAFSTQHVPVGAPTQSEIGVYATQPVPADAPTQSVRPLGRGAALLAQLKQLSASRSMPVHPEMPIRPDSSQVEQGAVPKGRGQPLSHPPVVSPPKQEASSPTEKMSELSVKGLPHGEFKGTCGTPVDLHVNYVRLKLQEGRGVFEYHVSFDPVVDSKGLRYRLLKQPECVAIIGTAKTFDGAKLYLPFRLSSQQTTVTTRLPTDGEPITIDIKFIRQCEPRDCIQFYNILFRRAMNILQMTAIRQHYYDPRQSVAIPQHKLEIWPGFITAIHEYDGGLLLNCDASFRVLRTNTAKDMLQDIIEKSRDVRAEAVQKLVGCIVLTRYNNKVYRIDDIDWGKNPMSKFTYSSGEEVTFYDYYRKHYDIQIVDLEQPLLINKAKPLRKNTGKEEHQLLCLIPELCYMTGLTDDIRSDFRVMKDIAAYTRIAPTEREAAMTKFIKNISTTPETVQLLKEWGVEFESASVGTSGRALPMENIIFKNATVPGRKEADWGQDLSRNHVICAVNLEHWLILFTKRDQSKADDFISTLKNVAPSMGIHVKDPTKLELRDDRTDTYLRSCRDNISKRIQLIVVIFPTSRDDRYSAFKKLCCSDMPVPSQVIMARTISQKPKLRSVTQKIALQINCKLGGELWAVEIPMKNIMVCGIDVYHDPTRKGRSVLGFVSSMNQRLTRWFSKVVFQEPGQELGDCLKVSLLATLNKYYEVNHTLPNRIFVFRDGVSDGQLQYVSQYEVEQMSTCFAAYGENYCPTLSVIVVQKKINTKIFLSLNYGSSYGNPGPGTVLDHTVTRKNMYDFFLVSQHVRQGTVSPTHYIVAHDSFNMKPDHMQRLAYKLTHLYYNWPGTIRVPAPCQYAHKLAYLVGQNTRKEPSDHLSDKLFFL